MTGDKNGERGVRRLPPLRLRNRERWCSKTFLATGVVAAILIVGMMALSSCQEPAAPAKLKIGVLPIVDALPFYVAEKEGYFREQKVEVELVLFASAVERDAAIQAGQIDGQLSDLISSGLLNKEKPLIRIVKVLYKATPHRAMISVLASPNSTARSLHDLKGAQVAISGNTVIEYVLDQLLAAEDLRTEDVEKIEVSKIPLRVEMLLAGQVSAAVLPEPMVSLAAHQGARVIADDSRELIGQSVLVFRQEVLREKAEAVKRLLEAHERAVKAVNGHPEQYRALLVEKARVPEAIKDTFVIPEFPLPMVSSAEDVARAVNWMVSKGLLPRPLAYDELVDATFLGK